jgi:hypothetical protein
LKDISVSRCAWLGVTLALAACNGSESSLLTVKPAKTEVVAHETELLRLTLSQEAVQRIGLEVTVVREGAPRQTRTVHGEIVAPPLTNGGLPTRSANDLAALAANQVRADGDVARARAELVIADKAAVRAEALVREEAGSARARDEALSAQAVARANLDAATAQRKLLGPSVAALEQKGLWVRAAAFASDLPRIDRRADATLHALGAHGAELNVRPVQGPASADPVAGTVDLYYQLDGSASGFRFGQRVSIDLPLNDDHDAGHANRVSVPVSAIVRDIYGGEWVYVQTAPQVFERRRVEVAAVSDRAAWLTRGPNPGTEVVTDGAAELFSTEFGAK